LAFPHPSSPKLIAVTTLVQQHIAWLEQEPSDCGLGHPNFGHRTEIDVAALDVRDAKIWNKRQ
jgi:hypothetical protein